MSGEWLLFQERTQQIAVSYHMTRLLGSVNRRTIRIWRELFDISYKNGEIYARKKEWKHSLENLNYDASLTEYMLDVHYSMKVSEVFYAKLSSFFILSPYWNAKKFLSLLFYSMEKIWHELKRKIYINNETSYSLFHTANSRFISLFQQWLLNFIFFSSISCCISMCLHFSEGWFSTFFLSLLLLKEMMTRDGNFFKFFENKKASLALSRHESKAWKL